MKKVICKFLLKLMGWKVMAGEVPAKKAIIIGVPHTSMWDFVISWLYYTSVGGFARVMVKKEAFFWPLGYFLRKMGAIPVDRSKGTLSLLKQTIAAFNAYEKFHMAIAPEGTRQLTREWKAGFHTIARVTGATVYLGYFDWGKKEVGWFEEFPITKDAEADIHRMKAFYREKGIVGKYPELFTTEG
ncbi:MAG TPA: 1-acyl-sn-glycerol-3-phosphate acyltransferase [Prolixibacteraceae bacterium]|nr:1-acyl-sn-glycerol-3-phosphate acyltransferase [Prolixibacteraceae bacterium]